MLSIVKSMAFDGLEGYLVEIHTDIAWGLTLFDVVEILF